MITPSRPSLNDLRGAILGTAIGDTIGLPYEGLSSRRVARWAPSRLRQQFLFGHGLVSDDTEHTFLVGLSLASTDSASAYQAVLARGLRLWLLTCPGGIGLATLRSLIRLNLGFRPERAGVNSAGNGPAMRAALVGLCVPSHSIADYITATTVLTHTDPRARSGALAVALAAKSASEGYSGAELLSRIVAEIEEPEMRAALEVACEMCSEGSGVADFVERLGLSAGVSGFVMHTVPVALFVAATARTFEASIETAVRLGGDTDSVAAVVGAIAGVRFGPGSIPEDWIAGITDWPLSVMRLELLAKALSDGGHPPRYLFGGSLVRNLVVFMPLVLIHGFRRLAPPY